MTRRVVASGYFDPLHIGHLRYLIQARQYGDELIVIINNDDQATLKKGVPFMPEDERLAIVSMLNMVDFAVLSVDKDRTVKETLRLLHPDVFVKGGDSTPKNTPEVSLCKEMGTEVIFGVGGDKIQSSSWLTHGKG